MDTTPESDFRRYRERGDAAALARVFDALAPKLLLVAQHLTRDAGVAEDLVQTTFLAALRDARGYDGRRPLVGWLAGILAHRAQDQRRRASVRATEPLGEELCAADDPLTASAERETLERITAAVDALEEPYRHVLVLRLVHGLAPTEIAHALGRAPGTVRMQLARARERLRERLPKELALPALFLQDEGAGLSQVRAEVLRAGRASAGPPIGATGSVAKVGVAGALVVGLAAVSWWWRAGAPSEAREGPAAEPRAVAGLLADEREPLDALESPAASVRETVLAPEHEGAAPPADEPAPRLRVRGLVTTLAGEPLADANIHVLESSSGGVGPVLTRSAVDGTFELEAPPEALIVARKSGNQPSGSRRGSARLPTRSVQPVVLVLRMGADGHALTGRVFAANGAPAAGARVAVCVDEDARKECEGMPVARERKGEKPLDRELLVLVADEEGRFASDEVPVGAATLLARSTAGEAIGWSELVVQRGEESRIELRLGPGAALTGRAHTTLPAESLSIRAEWSGEASLGALDDNDWGPLFSDRVAGFRADGGFTLEGLFPGRYMVRVRCGPLELAGERVELLAGEQRTLDFHLPAMVATRVRVLGPGGEPLAGWGLAWTAGESFDLERARERELPLELDGEAGCELSLELVEHAFGVHLPTRDPRRRNGFEALPRAIRRGVWPTASEIVWRLSEAEFVGGRVRGRWLDEHGVPLAAHEVRLQSVEESSGVVTTQTDEEGNFHLSGLHAGEFTLTAHEPGRLPLAALARFSLAAGEERELGDLHLPPSAHLTLEIIGADGETPEDLGGVLLDSDGEVLGPLRPAQGGLVSEPVVGEDVLVRILARGYPDHWRKLRLEAGVENRCRIELARGVPVELLVLLPPPVPACEQRQPGGRVHLTVHGVEGVPAFDQRLEAPLEPGRRMRLTLELPPGRYLGTLEDHTCDNAPRPMPEVRFDFAVEKGGSAPIAVTFH